MDNQFTLLVTAFFGLALGVIMTWLMTKAKIAAAFEQGKATLLSELATANERVRTLEADRTKTFQSQEILEAELNKIRKELELVSDQRAQLGERALRVPALETQVMDLLAHQKIDQQEIRRLATSEAEKAKSVQLLTAQLGKIEQALADSQMTLTSTKTLLQQAHERRATLEAELKAEHDALTTLRNDYQTEKTHSETASVQVNRLNTEMMELNTRLEAERSQAQEKLALLLEAKEALSNQFKSLANDILEEKSKRFAEQNQTNLGQLLNPLKDRLMEFKNKVEEIHNKDTEQQATLRAELSQLKDLNRLMTEEAHGLATALKGQAKKQGNWGELILGNVIDRSGLREGKDFKREVSFNTEEGRKRPDVIIYLPQSKHLVIDAKVSLNAYTRYVNAEDEVTRKQALQEHVSAVSSRIQELSSRSYFNLPGLNSPEMVFMFIPIESAFVEALRADENLFQQAIEQNVLVATPTTLLTSLNIVRQLWRFEEQNAHTAELAERAGKVYKKLVSFLASMDAVGKQLDKAKEFFGTAMGQLYTGKGNLISQAKEFEKLGVSVQTPLPEHLVAKAALELEHLPDISDESDNPER